MRPAAFSDDQILEAGRALVACGAAVNGFSLRKSLGGGNPKRLLDVWQRGGAVDAPAESLQVPDEVAAFAQGLTARVGEIVASAFVEFYGQLVGAARLDVERANRDLAACRSASVAECQQWAETVEDLENQNEALRVELDSVVNLKNRCEGLNIVWEHQLREGDIERASLRSEIERLTALLEKFAENKPQSTKQTNKTPSKKVAAS